MDKKYEVVLLPARSMYYTGLYLGCAYALQVSGSWLITMLVWAGTLAFYLVDRHARGICMDIWWLAAIKVVIYSTIVVGGTIFIYFSPSAEHLIYKNIMNAGGLIAELILNLYVFRVVTFEKYGWTELKG